MPGMSGVKQHLPSRSLPNPPSLVESGHHRFLIFDAPNNDNLPLYVNVSLSGFIEWRKGVIWLLSLYPFIICIEFDMCEEWKKFNIHHLVRACDPTYEAEPLRSQGITVHVCRISCNLMILWCTVMKANSITGYALQWWRSPTWRCCK